MTANLPAKHPLKQAADGISLMAFFTLFWAVVAAIALQGRDYGLVGGFFLVILLILVTFYVKFMAAIKKSPGALPTGNIAGGGSDVSKKKEGKRFMILFIVEAVAILALKSVLANTGLDDYFIPCLALIVGLHFFPLARIFKRSFDYFVGTWISGLAIAGIVLIYQKIWPPYLVTALVATGCALATSANGLRIVLQGNKMTVDNNIAIY